MSPTDPIARALNLSAGAVFHRCALQVNPHSYGEKFRGQPAAGDPEGHARAIVEKAVALGVSVLAITDHNDVSSVPVFRAAAADQPVDVFPGFELTSSDGIHVLCIYPPDCDNERLSRYLGELGIKSSGSSADLSSKSFREILATVQENGGLTIAAHVTGAKGLLETLSGQTRIAAWKDPHLLAAQIPGTVEDLPNQYRPIVENKDPAYRRDHAPEEGLALAVVNAKDVVSPGDLDHVSSTCWIKMSEVGIEGLRQAFLDPGSRIRLNPESVKEPKAELVALAWEGGGFLDGATIHFNPNLNVLVGGRGTGKSTILESIRAVMGLEAVGEEARKAHEGIVRNVLKPGTKISLLVRTHEPAEREYRIERSIPNPSVVRDPQGKVLKLSPRDVFQGIEIYGQHEIAELTRSPEKLTRLLDRFAPRDEALLRRKTDLLRKLEKNRRELLDVRAELSQIEDRLAELPALEETLARFREVGLEERLRDQGLLLREERVLTSIPERLETFRECLRSLKEGLPIDRGFLSERALEELPGKEILARADKVLAQLDADLEHVTRQLEQALERADSGIGKVHVLWDARKNDVQAAYEKILRELQKSQPRVDGQEFLRVRRQIEDLRPLREDQERARRLEAVHTESRRALLAEWEDLKSKEFQCLESAAKKISRELRGKIEVEVTAQGNREPLVRLLRQAVSGRLHESIRVFSHIATLSLTELVRACRAGSNTLSQRYNLPSLQAEQLANIEPEALMHIEELELPATTTIRLNTALAEEPPAWQALEDLSTGQKATAVLLLLLLESDAPLVVDQPEDDLDNRFITEAIVPRMREEKQRRQFIFSTHNANIPVLGDAELIVGLAATGEAAEGHGHVKPEHMGSIDSKPVRELIEEILEGGKHAFERRRRKYGF